MRTVWRFSISSSFPWHLQSTRRNPCLDSGRDRPASYDKVWVYRSLSLKVRTKFFKNRENVCHAHFKNSPPPAPPPTLPTWMLVASLPTLSKPSSELTATDNVGSSRSFLPVLNDNFRIRALLLIMIEKCFQRTRCRMRSSLNVLSRKKKVAWL